MSQGKNTAAVVQMEVADPAPAAATKGRSKGVLSVQPPEAEVETKEQAAPRQLGGRQLLLRR